jgi:L-fuconolactonase
MSLPPSISVVDAHVHFWDAQRLAYPWLAGVAALNRPFLPGDYAAAARPAAAGKLIFVESGCAAAAALEEVTWVSELAEREPRLRGIVAQAAVERGARVGDELALLAKNPLVKGVRRILQDETDAKFCLGPEFITGVRELAKHGFTFDLCIKAGQLPEVTELVRSCPEVYFVLDHCAKPPIRDRRPDPWRQHLRKLAAMPNVACKISGLVTEANPGKCGAEELRPYVVHALDCFGFDRVLFVGDWPVCNLACSFTDWLGALEQALAGASAANLAGLFQTNAERIYRV